jgi:hypothetical protein
MSASGIAMMAVAITRPDAETTGEISGGGWHGSCRRIRLARIQEGTANMDRRVWLML